MREHFNKNREERRNRWEARVEIGGGNSHIWTGVFILLIGIAALIRVSVPDLPGWLFSWKTFLIALGIFLGFKHNFKGPVWIILMLIGGAFLVRDFYPELAIRRYIWPSILVLIGAVMILRPKRGPWTCDDTQKKKKKDSAGIEEATIIDETHNHKEDFLDSTCIFSGSKKIIISKNFKGGDVVTVFGGTELDFSQADMTKPVTLEITTIFGGTKLIIPSNWEIKSEAVMIFGGIEDKRRMQTITGEPEKTLILRGTVLFGGIEIKSY
jgi:predicted membrane protein